MKLLGFQRYARPFARPLVTSRGVWAVREGFIVSLEMAGNVQDVEVCPLPEFGTETADEAEAWLKQEISNETLEFPMPPASLPCCRSAIGFATAWLPPCRDALANTALLGAGQGALAAFPHFAHNGFRSFKLKIAVSDTPSEVALCEALLKALPEGATLRLDANGAFRTGETEQWRSVLQHPCLAFVEQPLPVGKENEAHFWAKQTGCRIAFDESVAQMPSLISLAKDFPDAIFVIKPSLIGDIAGLLAWRNTHVEIPLVISSSFESAVGAGWVLRLAKSLPGVLLPVGLGTGSVAQDGLGGYPETPHL